MRRVAVIGVGVTKFGKHDRISAELFAEAAAQAIRDADIAPSAIEALYYSNVTGGEGERQLHMGPLAATLLGLPTIPTTRFENACATSHAAFRHALMEIASGVSDVVLVGGAERVLNVPTDAATEYFAYCSEATYEQSVGLTFPGVFALIARAHMEKYGTTEEEMARKRPRAVWVLGSAAASDTMFVHEKRDLSRVTATERAAAGAYRQAGKTPADVDVVELHDCFTIAEIVATEGLGFFEPGSGGAAAEKGWTALGGKIPVNPSGGLKAKGHPIGATGAAQIAEITTQLRGEAGARQVEGARTGLTHTLGGNTATVLVSLFGRG